MNTKGEEKNKKLKTSINRDLSYEEIGNLIKDDPIGRNEELKEVIKFIDSIEGNASIFLDADWGSGKTVFVKQLEMILWQLNSEKDDIDLKNKDEIIQKIMSEFSIESEQNYLPVYYSAWANDCYDDPLATIVSEIAIKSTKKFNEGLDVDISGIVWTSLDAVISLLGLPAKITDLKNNINKNDFFSSFKKKKELSEKVQKYINNVSKTTNSKILLIIDELDRCKPTFALELLESVKTLFNNENIATLYSVNTSELSKTVSTFYGQGLDGNRYLQRFYDFTFPLKYVPPTIYVKQFPIGERSSHFISAVSQDFANFYKLALRDQNLFYSSMGELMDIKTPNFADETSFGLIKCVAVPLIAGIKFYKFEDYYKIVKNNDYEIFKSYLVNCEQAINIIVSKIFARTNLDKVNDDIREQFIDKFCKEAIGLLFGTLSYDSIDASKDDVLFGLNCDCKKIFNKYL